MSQRQTETREVIVKYHGDLDAVGAQVGAKVEKLTEQYAIVTLLPEKIDELRTFTEIEYIELPKRLGIALDKSLREACITSVQNFPPYELQGEGVILGIIDSGIDYNHPDFINEDGSSRILYLWDQTLEGEPPEGFSEGREFTNDQINEALKQPTLRERLELVPSVDIIGHGTHVAGIAGGNGRASGGKYKGVAPKAEYIIVKLGRTGIESFPRTTELMRAVKYIIEKARKLGRPVAMNISFGTNEGPHDGDSIVETYLDDMANRWKTSIVAAVGNEGDTGHHIGGMIEQDEEKNIQFTIDQGETLVTLTGWKSFVDKMDFSLTAPNGETTGRISPRIGEIRTILGNTEVFAYFGEPSPLNGDQEFFISLTPVNQFIDNGIWTISLYGKEIVEGIYDIWLPIAEMVGDQTGFTEPTLNTTLTIPGSAERIITVGAYNGTTNQIAPFSGRGYARRNRYVKPDLVAPGVDIMAPFPGGGYDSLSGSSMASPHVAGAAALLMEWGIIRENDPFLYGEKLKSYLKRGAKRDRTFLEYPNPSWGYGSLCLENTFKNVDMRQRLNSQVNNDAVMSEEYADFIIEYEGDIEKIAEEVGAVSVQVLTDSYAILQVNKEEVDKCINTSTMNTQFQVPFLFGPYGKASLEASDILIFHDYPYGTLRGEDVLVGIIDSGIDYTQPSFLYEDNTTRILRIWDQTAQGDPPEGFIYGTEYTEDQINEALKSENPLEIVPEIDETGHGTFLAGIAAGDDRINKQYIGAAPDAGILVVKLKPAKQYLRDCYMIKNAETLVYQSNDVLTGLKYLVDTARKIGKPMAIILGIGSNQGGHDGSSITEAYIDELGGRRGIVMVTAAGNEGDTAHHAFGNLRNQQSVDIELKVADNEKGFELAIWSQAPDKMSVSIISPTGEYIERIPARFGEKEEVQLILEKTKIIIEYLFPEQRTGDQLTLIKFEDPTPGNWIITLYGDFIVNGRYDAWLPRKDWINDNTVFLSPVPFTTVTVPATGEGSITVGAYNHVDNSLYSGSGRGRTRDEEIKPDLVAPGVNVRGPLPNNQFGTMTGTSIAAAQTAGAVALLLEWGIVKGNDPNLNTRKVKTYLIRGAKRREHIQYPNPLWGYGELSLLQAFQLIRSLDNK